MLKVALWLQNDDPTKPLVACGIEGEATHFIPVEVEGLHISNASSGLRTTSTGQTTNEWAVKLRI